MKRTAIVCIIVMFTCYSNTLNAQISKIKDAYKKALAENIDYFEVNKIKDLAIEDLESYAKKQPDLKIIYDKGEPFARFGDKYESVASVQVVILSLRAKEEDKLKQAMIAKGYDVGENEKYLYATKKIGYEEGIWDLKETTCLTYSQSINRDVICPPNFKKEKGVEIVLLSSRKPSPLIKPRTNTFDISDNLFGNKNSQKILCYSFGNPDIDYNNDYSREYIKYLEKKREEDSFDFSIEKYIAEERTDRNRALKGNINDMLGYYYKYEPFYNNKAPSEIEERMDDMLFSNINFDDITNAYRLKIYTENKNKFLDLLNTYISDGDYGGLFNFSTVFQKKYKNYDPDSVLILANIPTLNGDRHYYPYSYLIDNEMDFKENIVSFFGVSRTSFKYKGVDEKKFKKDLQRFDTAFVTLGKFITECKNPLALSLAKKREKQLIEWKKGTVARYNKDVTEYNEAARRYNASVQNRRDSEDKMNKAKCAKCQIDWDKTTFPKEDKSLLDALLGLKGQKVGTIYMKNGDSREYYADDDGKPYISGFLSGRSFNSMEEMLKKFIQDCEEQYCK